MAVVHQRYDSENEKSRTHNGENSVTLTLSAYDMIWMGKTKKKPICLVHS